MEALTMMGIDPSITSLISMRPNGIYVEIFAKGEAESRLMTDDREFALERYYIRIEG